jgi:hypothetical protein
MNDDVVGTNATKPCIAVRHSELQRTDNSHYRRECPQCKQGLLSVKRNWNTFELEEFDHCVLCGQQFQYLDIDELRKKESNIYRKDPNETDKIAN